MDRRIEGMIVTSDDLAFEDAVARCDDGFGIFAGALLQGKDQAVAYRGDERGRGRFPLMALQLQAAMKRPELEQAHPFTALGSGHRQSAKVSLMGSMRMQSTGQGGTQSSQPEHSVSITVCMCLAAPSIASTGQA